MLFLQFNSSPQTVQAQEHFKQPAQPDRQFFLVASETQRWQILPNIFVTSKLVILIILPHDIHVSPRWSIFLVEIPNYGWLNQNTWEDRARFAFPISLNACECQSFSEIQCVAYCGPANVKGYEIKTQVFAHQGEVVCPANTKVVSCSMKNTERKFSKEFFKKFAPSADGSSCLCYDYWEGVCGAICVTLPIEYEIVSSFGHGNVLAECPVEKSLLGCGVMAKQQMPPEEKPSYNVGSKPDTCSCSSSSGVTCYAICFKWHNNPGKLWILILRQDFDKSIKFITNVLF